jgi:hypothetical protein
MLHRNMNVKWRAEMLNLDDVRVMCSLITKSKHRVNQDWMWGSPRYNTLVYKIPGWDITYTRERISTDPEKKTQMFGKVFRHGVTYDSHQLSHNDYFLELREIIHWNTPNLNWQAQDANWGKISLMEWDYVGDIEQLLDAIVYWKLQESLD